MTCRKKIGLGSATVWIVGRLAVVMAVILLPCGAGAQQGRAAADIPAPPGAAPNEPSRQDFPESVLESLRTALGVYEEVRGELATDRLEGVQVRASQLADALRLVLDGRAGLAREVPVVIEEAVLIAESMVEVEDLAAARAEFGEMSRLVLLLAGYDPRLADGWHVFACPMAKTFGKWMQPTEALENPYMGQAMPACGFRTDWSVPAASPAGEEPSSTRKERSPAKEDSGAEPVFRPGIPGVKMVDVRDHRFLWREIEELQKWERGDRISVAEYRSKVIEKTAHFLGFGGATADEFAAVAAQAVAGLRESFLLMRRAGENPGALETRFSSDLPAGVSGVTSFLRGEPRHRLFAPECKKWLLKLAFGPSEAKEAMEAERAAPTSRAGEMSSAHPGGP